MPQQTEAVPGAILLLQRDDPLLGIYEHPYEHPVDDQGFINTTLDRLDATFIVALRETRHLANARGYSVFTRRSDTR